MRRSPFIAAIAGAASLFAGASAIAAVPLAAPGDKPMFSRQPSPRTEVIQATALPTWTFSYSYNGSNYTDQFVGTDPAGGASTTIPVYIIPIKMVYGTTSFSTSAVLPNGKTVLQNTLASPMFNSSVDYVQGGTDVGTTQYTDAFERANFWGTVAGKPGYHVLLGTPIVEPEQTLTVPSADGKVATTFGTRVIEAYINWFDNKVKPMLTKFAIPANALPIFVTTQTYLTQIPKNGCCIGGYHSYTGRQAYSHFTYIQTVGAFAQDVSALSHEVSEWMDDPTTSNNSPCGIYEVGDPLEGLANYGGYPYTVGGFTYNLQDEVTPVYFGAPASTSLHSAATFQGMSLTVCQNGS